MQVSGTTNLFYQGCYNGLTCVDLWEPVGQHGVMTQHWRRLADTVVRRRAELNLTQADVAQRGQISIDRVQNIEGAKRTTYRLGTLAALERALEWAPGSVQAILDGDDPTPLTTPAAALPRAGESIARSNAILAELEERLDRLRRADEREQEAALAMLRVLQDKRS